MILELKGCEETRERKRVLTHTMHELLATITSSEKMISNLPAFTSVTNELRVRAQKRKKHTRSIFLFLFVALITTMFDASKFARECWDARYAPFQPWLLVCVDENYICILLHIMAVVWLVWRAHDACTNNILYVLSIYVHKNIKGVNLISQYSTLISKFNIFKIALPEYWHSN